VAARREAGEDEVATRTVPVVRQAMSVNAASPADHARSSYRLRWSPHQRVLFESIAAAVCA